MADLATNAFTTYSASVNREDLADIVKMIDPVETWFQSTISDTTATASMLVEPKSTIRLTKPLIKVSGLRSPVTLKAK